FIGNKTSPSPSICFGINNDGMPMDEEAEFLCDRYYLSSPPMKLELHYAFDKDKPISLVAVLSEAYGMEGRSKVNIEYIGK
ncbi:hypothetical protein GCK32_014574, partial [Trichostrongylus colubriformis]